MFSRGRDRNGGQQPNQKPEVLSKNPFKVRGRRGKRGSFSEENEPINITPTASTANLNLNRETSFSIPEQNALSPFDACIEACDTIAAQYHEAPEEDEFDQSRPRIKDCSVRVSPDGFLIMNPVNRRTGNRDDQLRSNSSSMQEYEDMGAGDLDLESSVVLGFDVEEDSDKAANGFSARGWSRAATSLALRQCVDAMDSTETFCDAVSESHVQHYTAVREAARKLFDEIWEAASSNPKTTFYSMDSPTSNEYIGRDGSVKRAMRMGPLLQPGTSMNTALTAMEAYYSKTSQSEVARWRWDTKHSPSDYFATHGAVLTSRKATATSVLSSLREAKNRTKERGENRERALEDALQRAVIAQQCLSEKKAIAKEKWALFRNAQRLVNHKLEDMEHAREMDRERRRVKDRKKREHVGAPQAQAQMHEEVWTLLQQLGDSTDYSPTDGSRGNVIEPIQPASTAHVVPLPDASLDGSPENSSRAASPGFPPIDRTSLEIEYGLHMKRIDATAAEDDVEDAAGALLNALSVVDNARRAARIAAETCLLSAAKAQKRCLKSMVQLERESLLERLACLDELEAQVNAVNVRADLDTYIENDKQYPGGRTEGCENDDDDGGIASALAVLNCHAHGAGVINSRMSAGSGVVEGWGDNDDDDVGCEDVEDTIQLLFFSPPFTDALVMEMIEGPDGIKQTEFHQGVHNLVDAVSDPKATSLRTSVCYALNAQRGVECQIKTQVQFQGVCELMRSVLSGCTKSSSDIANAKMTMMLSQTFYKLDTSNSDDAVVHSITPTRRKRIYAKSFLIDHPLWADDDFWDHALFQCVSEALTKSNVMHNLQRAACVVKLGSLDDVEESTLNKVKWHDFLPEQRLEAASQLHSVVFAQLGALSHSMLEFGCSFNRAVNFVRRLAVRHQLPIRQRAMLLQHLLRRKEHEVDHSPIRRPKPKPALVSLESGFQVAPTPNNTIDEVEVQP